MHLRYGEPLMAINLNTCEWTSNNSGLGSWGLWWSILNYNLQILNSESFMHIFWASSLVAKNEFAHTKNNFVLYYFQGERHVQSLFLTFVTFLVVRQYWSSSSLIVPSYFTTSVFFSLFQKRLWNSHLRTSRPNLSETNASLTFPSYLKIRESQPFHTK